MSWTDLADRKKEHFFDETEKTKFNLEDSESRSLEPKLMDIKEYGELLSAIDGLVDWIFEEISMNEKEMFDENYINVQMQVDINKNKAAIREAEEKAKQLKRKARVEQIRYEKRMMEEAEKRMLAQKAKLKEEMESLEVETPDETNTENDTSSENVSE